MFALALVSANAIKVAAADGSFTLSRPLVVSWSYETRQLAPLIPAAFADVLYAPLAGGVVAAVRPQDGRLLWRGEAGGQFSAAPAADERGVYVSSELRAEGLEASAIYTRGVVRSLSRTSGVTLWTRTVPNAPEGALVIADGLLLGAAADGRIYALDKQTGAPAWIIKTDHAFRTTPVVAGDRLMLAADDGYLLSVELKTGTVAWRYRTGAASAAPFSVSGRMLYVGSADGFVTALRDAGGRLETLWRRRAGTSVQGITSTPAGLLVASRDNFVHFLSHRNGNRLWKRQMPGRVLGAPLVGSDGALYALLGGEVCVALSLSDGKQVNTLPLGEGNVAGAQPQSVGAFVIVPTRNGLVAFAPSDTPR